MELHSALFPVFSHETKWKVDKSTTVGICEYDFATRAKIVREIGSGRFGTVNLIQMEIEAEVRRFAAKYYEYDSGSETKLDEFAKLLGAFSSVDHPCLANVLHYQKPVRDSGPIIATEYFEFGSLDLLLNDVRGGRRVEIWTPTAQVLVICGIVSGLLSLHSHYRLHGYLKPTDILLDSEFNVHLTDYLSFSFERYGLASSSMVASLIYTAPELSTLDGVPFDINNRDDALRFMPIDVYAVGLICYEILTGHKVFSPELNAADLQRKAVNSQDRPQIPSYIEPDFGRLIVRCWDSDPSKRPPMGEIWDTLERMNCQIIDGVDHGLLRERVTPWVAEVMKVRDVSKGAHFDSEIEDPIDNPALIVDG
jgi:serine/threonine protein kinase